MPEAEGQLEKRQRRISKTLVCGRCRLRLFPFHSAAVARRRRYRAAVAWDLFPNTLEATFRLAWEPCPSPAASSAPALEFRKHPHFGTTVRRSAIHTKQRRRTIYPHAYRRFYSWLVPAPCRPLCRESRQRWSPWSAWASLKGLLRALPMVL